MTAPKAPTHHVDIAIRSRGGIEPVDEDYARDKIEHLIRLAHGPVLAAKVDLVLETDPARARPAIAEAQLDVNGRPVRAHVAAVNPHEAVDLLEAKLRTQLERAAHREEAAHLRHRGDGEHEWHHGDRPTQRPGYFPRPREDRRVVRTKTYAIDAMTVDEAAFDLELLDHDFYLFHNLDTGEDNVIARAADGGYELIEPSPSVSLRDAAVAVHTSKRRPSTMPVAEAIDVLDLTEDPFVFFLDPVTCRGEVLYRRYDGHYGLIVKAEREDGKTPAPVETGAQRTTS